MQEGSWSNVDHFCTYWAPLRPVCTSWKESILAFFVGFVNDTELEPTRVTYKDYGYHQAGAQQ